jgi:hypothetical protein
VLSLLSFCGHIVDWVLSCVLYVDIICTGYCVCDEMECYSQCSILYIVIFSDTHAVKVYDRMTYERIHTFVP